MENNPISALAYDRRRTMERLRGMRKYAEGAFAVSMHSSADAVGQAILMHDPVGFHAFGSAALIEHQSFLHADLAHSPDCGVNGLVGPRGLPVPRRRCSIGPRSVGVLSVPWTEEIPLSLSEYRLPCMSRVTILSNFSVHRMCYHQDSYWR